MLALFHTARLTLYRSISTRLSTAFFRRSNAVDAEDVKPDSTLVILHTDIDVRPSPLPQSKNQHQH